jgi:hypothetical protein
MPLSDRERQILSDIEARLREEDPKFARTVGTTTVSTQARRRIKLAVAGFVVGLVLLFGIVAHIAWGLAGAALMLVSVIYGGTMLKRIGQNQPQPSAGQARSGFQRYLGEQRGRDDERQ